MYPFSNTGIEEEYSFGRAGKKKSACMHESRRTAAVFQRRGDLRDVAIHR